MKSFFLVLFVAQVVLQTIHTQCIRSDAPSILAGCRCGSPACGQTVLSSPGILAGCGCGSPACGQTILASPAIVQSSSVAASLADTLSLLTVSSLLADTLPLGPNVVVAPSCGCGGCGCGGYGGYGGYYY